MRRITVFLHMLLYGSLWGGIVGGIAFALTALYTREMGTFLFVLAGIFQGLRCGAISGLIIGVITCSFFFPSRDVAKYERGVVPGYACVSALSLFVPSFLQFLGPDVNGGGYADPLGYFVVIILIPSVLMGLLSLPAAQRLASWFIAQKLKS